MRDRRVRTFQVATQGRRLLPSIPRIDLEDIRQNNHCNFVWTPLPVSRSIAMTWRKRGLHVNFHALRQANTGSNLVC